VFEAFTVKEKGFRLTAACLGGSLKQRSYNQRNWPPEINDITKKTCEIASGKKALVHQF
jgi:hypothetical protein